MGKNSGGIMTEYLNEIISSVMTALTIFGYQFTRKKIKQKRVINSEKESKKTQETPQAFFN